MKIDSQIAAGLEAMRVDLPAEARKALAAHLRLIEKWNRVHNLTAVREPLQMVALHVLDSLSIVPHLGDARKVADIGSGAGFPGIPIAIARPDLAVTLVDSSHKKSAFLEQVKSELRLSNLTVACERVEQWEPADKFDLIVSRAFSDLPDFVAQSSHLLRAGGSILAMKGVYPFEEIARIAAPYRVSKVVELEVATLNAKRHLVFLEAA